MRRTRLNPMSAKRRAALGPYRALVTALRRRARGHCENPWHRAAGYTLDPAHFPKRSQGAPLADADHLLLLCRMCHEAADNWPRARIGALQVEPLGNECFRVACVQPDGRTETLKWRRP